MYNATVRFKDADPVNFSFSYYEQLERKIDSIMSSRVTYLKISFESMNEAQAYLQALNYTEGPTTIIGNSLTSNWISQKTGNFGSFTQAVLTIDNSNSAGTIEFS